MDRQPSVTLNLGIPAVHAHHYVAIEYERSKSLPQLLLTRLWVSSSQTGHREFAICADCGHNLLTLLPCRSVARQLNHAALGFRIGVTQQMSCGRIVRFTTFLFFGAREMLIYPN